MASWQDILTRLRQGATEHPKLSARWHSREKRWTHYSGAVQDAGPADPEAEHDFKEAARAALALAGKSAGLAPPWCVWLDLLRQGNRGFCRIKQHRPVSFSLISRHLEQGTELPEHAYRLLEDGTIPGIFRESAELFEDIVPNPNGTPEPKPDQSGGADPGTAGSASDVEGANSRGATSPAALRTSPAESDGKASQHGPGPTLPADVLDGEVATIRQ